MRSSGLCTGGATVNIHTVDDVTSASQVPVGSQGSLVFIETMRDLDLFLITGGDWSDFRIRSAPHEIGHQFGIEGDAAGVDFGIMNPTGDLKFVDRHLNVLRWRKRSPGGP